VLVLNQKPYITFVSNNYIDKIGNNFFEDWGERKWRIISQYIGYENKKAIQSKRSLQDRLKDICYFILIRNINYEKKS
jgi:hypothetical protein